MAEDIHIDGGLAPRSRDSSLVSRGLATLAALGRWLRGLLIAYMLLDALIVLGIFYVVVLFIPSMESNRTLIMFNGVTVLINLAIYLITAILFCLWVHRAHANLRDMGLDGLTYSPGWATGSIFVPFANLVVPFRAMRELVNRSNGEEAHLADGTAPDVNSWWTCFLVGSLITFYLNFISILAVTAQIYVTAPPVANQVLMLFSSVLAFGAAFFLLRIVGSVTVAQRSMTGVSEIFS